MNVNPNISKLAETFIWNEIMESYIPFNQKMKLCNRLRQNNYPKFAIQQTLEVWMNKYEKK